MNISELLQFVDDAMYAKTGKHLNDLQRKIMKGVLDHQKYSDIASLYDLSEGHVKDVGYELLQMMSNAFNEPITKGNIKSVLERQGSVSLSFGNRSINSHIIGYVDFGSDRTEDSSQKNQSGTTNFSSSFLNIQTTVKKLRQRGLSNEEIADVLDIPVQVIKNVEI
jgi:hypothetical protein